MMLFMRKYFNIKNIMNCRDIVLNYTYIKMINIQNEINDILQNKNISKQEKLWKLTVLLKWSKCDFLVDFDDTISDYRCLLYSKYKYLGYE